MNSKGALKAQAFSYMGLLICVESNESIPKHTLGNSDGKGDKYQSCAI